MANVKYYIDEDGDGQFDIVVTADSAHVFTNNKAGTGRTNHQKNRGGSQESINAQIKSAAESLASNMSHDTKAVSESDGAGFGIAISKEMTGEYKPGEGGAYGAPSISKEDFFNADGTQKDPREVAKKLKAAGAEGSEDDIYAKVLDAMPQLEKVSEKEKGFLAKERGFAEKGAEMGKEADIYGLQKGAGKVGAQMRGVYGGMGAGARGVIGGQAALGKGVEKTYDKYGLGMEKAAFAEEKGLYGLTEGVGKEFESEITTTFFAKKGGRVPDKESFSNFLTQLPDAGGM